MPNKVDTSKLHSLVTAREDAFKRYVDAHEAYLKACETLRNAINQLNKTEDKVEDDNISVLTSVAPEI